MMDLRTPQNQTETLTGLDLSRKTQDLYLAYLLDEELQAFA